MLRDDFVPVALDQAYERRRKDAIGEFYRKLAGQSPRKDFSRTTQGFYVATANGELLLYNNNRDPKKVRRLLEEALREFANTEPGNDPIATPEAADLDPRYAPKPPDGGFVVRVRARVLGGYAEPSNDWQRIFHTALSRDNLWVTAKEHQALVAGQLPRSLLRRLARFHLVDNTRGEPPMWRTDEVRALEVIRDGERIAGMVQLATSNGSRTYDTALRGRVRIEGDRVATFELFADGLFCGEGRYTKGAPKGQFPFAVAFELADQSDVADAIPPQGSRGWVEGYFRH